MSKLQDLQSRFTCPACVVCTTKSARVKPAGTELTFNPLLVSEPV
jgi:hypothetical protein